MNIVDPTSKNKDQTARGQYDANYGNFRTALYEEIRREAFGEDIGQNSWLTAAEQDRFVKWLDLAAGKVLLDVACGAGGPSLRIAEVTGCSVVGVDVQEQAIAAARSLAKQRRLDGRTDFRTTDAKGPLPFSDSSFDAVTCIDAINHFPDRSRLILEWVRLLKPGGQLLFTDPITVTGPLTNSEIATRSSASFYLYVPTGYDERILEQCGLRLVLREDATANMAQVAEARRAAREKRSAALREIEGVEDFENQQAFLATAARVAKEGRLSRFAYVAKKAR
jgi:2-polyprenyl-3-methyl-5-hydroxy-6-metoxy-1,4-benzoquinol methylase